MSVGGPVGYGCSFFLVVWWITPSRAPPSPPRRSPPAASPRSLPPSALDTPSPCKHHPPQSLGTTSCFLDCVAYVLLRSLHVRYAINSRWPPASDSVRQLDHASCGPASSRRAVPRLEGLGRAPAGSSAGWTGRVNQSGRRVDCHATSCHSPATLR